MPARYDRRRATVVAFDAPEWNPPEAVVIDTNVIAEMMLPDEAEHASCEMALRRLRAGETVVVFNRLLELERWEVVYEHALRHAVPGRDRRLRRFEKAVRSGPAVALERAQALWHELLDDLTWQRVEIKEVADAVPDLMRAYGLQSYDAVHAATLLASGVTDMVTRDAGFAVLLPEDATLHTTRRRLSRTRARRRDACGGG
jgi:predicted nucleic acid-binding protein